MATAIRGQSDAGTAHVPVYRGASKRFVKSHANVDASMPDGILPALTHPALKEYRHENGDSGDTEHQERSPVKPEGLIRLRRQTLTARRFEVLQRWEGVVLDVDSDVVNARLNDLTDPSKRDEFVEFEVSELSKSDRRIVAPGAVFYWSVGYETLPGGQIRRVSEIRLRRAPEWSNRTVAEILLRANELYAELIDGESSPASAGQ